MPRFKELSESGKKILVAILKQRLGTRDEILNWIRENDADREPGQWGSMAMAIPKTPAKIEQETTLYDTGAINGQEEAKEAV